MTTDPTTDPAPKQHNPNVQHAVWMAALIAVCILVIGFGTDWGQDCRTGTIGTAGVTIEVCR